MASRTASLFEGGSTDLSAASASGSDTDDVPLSQVKAPGARHGNIRKRPQLNRMSRYFFDVREGQKLTPDDDGVEFDSLDAAEHEAVCAAAEIGRDRLPKGDSREVTVEVKNEHGQRVLTIKVSMEVDRVDPAPEPPRR
jgi:hypothetical protein